MSILDLFAKKDPEKVPVPDLPPSIAEVATFTMVSDTVIKVNVMEAYRGTPVFLSWVKNVRQSGYVIQKINVLDADSMSRQAGIKKIKGSAEVDTKALGQIRFIFQIAANRKSSDIHILLDESGGFADIKTRINGSLMRVLQLRASEAEDIFRAIYQSGISVSDSGYKPGEYQAGQVVDKRILPEIVDSIRIQRGPMMNGRFMVLRLLYNGLAPKQKIITNDNIVPKIDKENVSLEEGVQNFIKFGFTESQARTLALAARKPAGMVIFSGPTGSAKSSALKTAIDYQSRLYPEKAIYTIEDPPEYKIIGARQLPVLNAKDDKERAQKFQEALRVAMRSDPDILMVGEIRDPATATTAVDATITGHQMWTTVHALDSFLIPARLINFGIKPHDLMDPSVLTALVAQRLVPKLCKCSISYADGSEWLDPDIRVRIEQEPDGPERIRIKNPSGCDVCKDTPGIVGRIVVAEVISVTQDLLDKFNDGSSSARDWYKKNYPDALLMPHHGWQHVMRGLVDPRDLIAIVGDPPPYERGSDGVLLPLADGSVSASSETNVGA